MFIVYSNLDKWEWDIFRLNESEGVHEKLYASAQGERESGVQCDQIWLKFTTIAKFSKHY